MSSLGDYQKVRARIETETQRWEAGATLAQIRQGFDALLANNDPGGRPFPFRSFAGRAFGPAEADGTVLYCHGGGYQIGSMRSHGPTMSSIAALSDLTVIGFSYRKAPEHRFPAAAEDAFTAYRELLERGLPASTVRIAGDSAGGALALGVALQARAEGLPAPRSIALISPWLDLAMRGRSYEERAERDFFSKKAQLAAMAKTYLGRDGDRTAPLASPLNADLTGMPPIVIHAGEDDITYDDATLLVSKADAVGVPVEFRSWPGMFHHFQLFGELAQARESLAQIAAFLAR